MNLKNVAQDLVRLSARSITLSSGSPAMLELPAGNKFSKQSMSHEDLTEILLESAPRHAIPELQVGRAPAPFLLSVDGSSFLVKIEARPQYWRVTVKRDESEDDGGMDIAGFGLASAPMSTPSLSPQATRPQVEEPMVPSTPPLDVPRGGFQPTNPYGAPPVQASPPGFGSSPTSLPPIPGLGTPSSPAPVAPVAPPAPPQPSLSAPVSNGFNSTAPVPMAGPALQVPPAYGGPGMDVVHPGIPTGHFPPPAYPPYPYPPPGYPAYPPPPPPPAGHGDAGGSSSYTPHVSKLKAGQEPEINEILRRMVTDKASDVHLTATMPPKYRVGGNVTVIPGFEVLTDEHLREMIFDIMPERNRREYLETNDTDFAHSIEGLSRFRVNIATDRHGMFAVIRRIPFEILTPEQIGLPKKVLDLCYLTKGLVLVTGPTGSGKSTTLATMVDYINSNRQDHIVTIEDPIEFVHPDNKRCLIRQREVGEHTTSFKRALKAALREDPNIVLVGEMRDLETIAIAIETAETGHLVFGTLHTSTAPSTVDRIIDQFPSSQQEQIRMMLSESLKGVIAQTLCKKIGGGRVAAYEVLIGTKAVSNLIREAKTFQLYSIMQTNKQAGMVTLSESLLKMVTQKIITPEEGYMKAVDKEEIRNHYEKMGIRMKLQQTLDE